MRSGERFVPVCVSLALCLLFALSRATPLRLHVVANSNSAFDQETKLAVRDAVLCEMQGASPKNEAEAEVAVQTSGRRLQDAAERVLAERGANYGASLYLGNSVFPDRTYGGTSYPAGSYRALRVVLGDGAGENWWCVIYPPLCLADMDEDERVTFKSLFYELYKLIFGVKS